MNPPARTRGPLHDDGPLPDFISGLMWLATAVVGVAVLAIPGTPHPHLAVALVLAGFAAGWGVLSLWLGLTARTMTIGRRATVTAAMMPIVALALWATGGADSYLQPVLLFTALFIAYFFSPRLAWPLVALFCGAFFSPLAYDPQAIELGYPARGVLFLVAVAGQAVTVHYLKHRLLAAEAVQRGMAERDPLTGLYNRRSFDHALARSTDDGSAALVLFDFDGFKAVTTSTATRSATPSCAPSPRRARAWSATATAWRASAATSSRSSPQARPEPASSASSRPSARRSPMPRAPPACPRCRSPSRRRWPRRTRPTPASSSGSPMSACSPASASSSASRAPPD
ncbi:MAG TPA: GGDEF domain-containing protein, partial [Solirubrobacteraceae bacterium]